MHNLVKVGKELGLDSAIVYFPFDARGEIPAPYRNKYEIDLSTLEDREGDFLIYPEILAVEALKIKRATAAIWWLSVDNFVARKYGGIRDKVRYFLRVMQRRRPAGGVASLSRLIHISKAAYDREFLRKHGISALQLEGPISDTYLSEPCDTAEATRENIILFNPRKDRRTIAFLKSNFSEFSFVPLRDLGEVDMQKLYRSAKLYVDFGHHPGKERMPREAAVSGCCVITGRRGSAGNAEDVPILEKYKIDQYSPNFVGIFKDRVMEIFGNFDRCQADFDSYRKIIRNEPIIQRNQLESIIDKINISKSA